MTLEQNRIDQLTAFRQRDKFSDQAWNKRGLNPSAWEASLKLTELFNQCADTLIDAVGKNASDKQLKTILRSHLSNFSKRDYDTEEKEFVCDLFYELAQIIEIDFADNLNRWLYGSTMSVLLKIQATFNPRKVLDTIEQTCLACGGAINTFIIRREEGIPDYSWNIESIVDRRWYDFSENITGKLNSDGSFEFSPKWTFGYVKVLGVPQSFTYLNGTIIEENGTTIVETTSRPNYAIVAAFYCMLFLLVARLLGVEIFMQESLSELLLILPVLCVVLAGIMVYGPKKLSMRFERLMQLRSTE